jgi:hypothetical protein
MLPTGHFAAGYLTTKLALTTLLPAFPQALDTRFWVVGLVASVATDLDNFYFFAKIGSFLGGTKDQTHRDLPSHAPMLHLAISVVAFGLATILGSSDFQLYAIVYLTGTWTHFLFDSFALGLRWLWPFSKKLYAFRDAGKDLDIQETSFFPYWITFIKLYTRSFVFFIEVIVILSAAIVFLPS